MAPEQYKCEACSATFSSESELKEHKHSKCEACGATFRSESELKEHTEKKHGKS